MGLKMKKIDEVKLNEVYKFICKVQSEERRSPTYREIGDRVWLVAGTVQYYLRNLRKKGYIDFIDNKCRTIRLVKGEQK